MQDDYPQYELLTRHLDPQFGNIYEYNMAGGDVGYDIQEWTPELRKAVKDYLLHHCPPDIFARLFPTADDQPFTPEGREAAVDTYLDLSEPWLVAFKVRHAAVAMVPTLRQLIGHLDDWPSEDERLDAETRLETHGDSVEWQQLAAVSNHPELVTIRMWSGAIRQPQPNNLVHELSPPELLSAWENVVGTAPTDLTDVEWRLLAPHFGARNGRWGELPRSADELNAKRRTFNAIRFKDAHPMPCPHLPPRYGPSSVYQSYRHYQAEGLFVRLRDGLRDNPDAAQLVAWLEQVIADGRPKRRSDHAST